MTEKQNTRMRELVDRLNETSYAYYVLDNPVISDKQWDQLYDELKQLENETGTVFDDSPTRHVGGEPLQGFENHTHLHRLWSMDKVQTFEGLNDWLKRTEKTSNRNDLRYCIEYKFDGLTINLTYRDGKLVQAATRGNGITGEVILDQVRTIKSIPSKIPYKGLMEVQGECIMRLRTLEKYNREHPNDQLKNARNAAAGALRNLDPAVTASRHLDAFFYQIGTIDHVFETQNEMLAFLKENGFQISPFLQEGNNISEIKNGIEKIGEERHSLDWLIDGVVIKVADFSVREKLGETDKYPRWAIAYKFPAEEAVTRLNNVTWELGRTGKLTPLAHLEPVDFYGVTVQKATLNNYGDILRKKVRIGCDVWVRRSNDVIPEIIGRTDYLNENELEIIKPDRCPACGSELTERGAHIFCMNRESCRPQAIARITHFAGREAMDIDGLSEKTAGLLYDRMHVRNPSDLYMLTAMDFLSLDGYKEKKANKLFDALEKSKTCKLDAFLFAIGIPNVGRKTARDIAGHFGTLENIKKADREELTEISDIGEVVAQSIIEFFSFRENTDMVEKLLSAGIVVQQQDVGDSAGIDKPLIGKTIVVTGTLTGLSRQEAEEMIRQAGGTAASSVSRKTSFVVAGENAGSKLAKANELGIEVVDQNEFEKRAGIQRS